MKLGRKKSKSKAAKARPAKRTKAARFRVRGLKWGSAAVLLALLASVIASGLLVVWQTHEVRQLHKGLEAVRHRQDHLLDEHSRLLLERGALSAYYNVERGGAHRVEDAVSRPSAAGAAMKAWRHHLVVWLFFVGCAALAGRVLHLTLLEKEFLQDQGDARSVREEIIPSHRGVIYDRLGEPLAVSTPTVSVWSDPSRATLSEGDIKRLAPLLQTSPKALAERLDAKRGKSFVYLKRRSPGAWRSAFERWRSRVFHFRSEYRRYYPAAETAAHVVGITNMDDVGLEGVELAFDKRLRGRHGRKVVLKDRLGAVIRDLDYVAAPRFGQDLALSIDLRLQYFAYRELKDAVLGHGAASGSIVILDARSGEILALANSPSYNPNASLATALAGMRNRAVTDTYEPGSTIKPFAALAALESGQYAADTLIDTAPGYLSVRGKLIEDPSNYGELTLAGVVRKSSQGGHLQGGVGAAGASHLQHAAPGRRRHLHRQRAAWRVHGQDGRRATEKPHRPRHLGLWLRLERFAFAASPSLLDPSQRRCSGVAHHHQALSAALRGAGV